MLILAGVSLNAVIGDNGIITQAQSATYMQSVAILEEFFNNYYIEHYEEMKDADSKVVALSNLEQNWFYMPVNEGIGSLRYITDSEGNALYLIKKENLPEDLKNQIKGGNAGEGKYADYISLEDVYGVTSNLKVYYCRNGKDDILGISKEELDKDNPLREVFNKEKNSDIYKLLSIYDVVDNNGNNDGILTSQELKAVKKLTINEDNIIESFEEFYNLTSLQELTLENVKINSLEGIQNCSLLHYIYFKGCIIDDYSAVGKLGSRLDTLYFYNINDTELQKVCDTNKGIGKYDLNNLESFAVVGNENFISIMDVTQGNLNNSGKSINTITSLKPLENLNDVTKKAIKNLSLQNNNIQGKALESLKGFDNLILLRIEYNAITSLNGVLNMNNLQYLYASYNDLGKDETNTINPEIDSLSELSNLNNLYYLNLNNNNNLKNLNYLKECYSLKYFRILNCTNLNVSTLNEIINMVKQCITFEINGSYDLIFLDNKKTIDLSNQSIEKEIFLSLKNKQNIEILNLENLTLLENGNLIEDDEINETINSVLKSLNNLRSVRCFSKDKNYSISKLETIDFIDENSKLEELDLRGTNVENLDNLNKLNTLKVLLIDNPNINLLSIQEKISSYWGGYKQSGDMQVNGLYLGNVNLIKQLESCTEITRLNLAGGALEEYNVTAGIDLDLSLCNKLEEVEFNRVRALVKFPESLKEYSGYTNSLNDFSLCSNLESLSMNGYDTTGLEFDEFIKTINASQSAVSLIFTTYSNKKVNEIVANLNLLSDSKIYELRFSSTNSEKWNFEDLSFIKEIISLNSIDINYANIKNLKGIENLINLEKISITNTELSDLSSLSIQNTKLKKLTLNNNKINDLRGIDNLSNIEELYLSNNNVTSLKLLEGLSNLRILNLENNCIYDNSSYIDEGGSTITYKNLDIIKNLNQRNLKSIYLKDNIGITDFSIISDLNWNGKSGF